jgi:hypothetical protein
MFVVTDKVGKSVKPIHGWSLIDDITMVEGMDEKARQNIRDAC